MTNRTTGTERLLRAVAKFDDEAVPTNARGQIDFKNLTLRLREITSGDGDWQVREEDRQNFYRSDELKTAVDILSSRHRLAARAGEDDDEDAKSRIAQVKKRANADREGAVYARGQYAAVLQKLAEAQTENASLRRQVEALSAQLDMVRSGILPRVK